jgi:hypothetical protein
MDLLHPACLVYFFGYRLLFIKITAKRARPGNTPYIFHKELRTLRSREQKQLN